MDILNLKDLEVLEIQENTFDYLITAQAKERPKFCIKCYSDSLIRHSTNEMMVSDVRIHDKRTKINIIRRRYKCKSCGYTFYELLSSVDTDFRTTKRLRSSIEKESLKKTFKSLRDRILEQSETLTTAYWFKEMIREMYRSETKRQAHEWFYTIESSIPKGKEFKVFRDLFKTYNNCKPEIMNYFDARYTNAYTESINNQIKRVEKAGAGYSYEVLRAKCIYGLQQPSKPKFGSMGFKKVSKVEVEEFSSYFEPHCLCA